MQRRYSLSSRSTWKRPRYRNTSHIRLDHLRRRRHATPPVNRVKLLRYRDDPPLQRLPLRCGRQRTKLNRDGKHSLQFCDLTDGFCRQPRNLIESTSPHAPSVTLCQVEPVQSMEPDVSGTASLYKRLQDRRPIRQQGAPMVKGQLEQRMPILRLVPRFDPSYDRREGWGASHRLEVVSEFEGLSNLVVSCDVNHLPNRMVSRRPRCSPLLGVGPTDYPLSPETAGQSGNRFVHQERIEPHPARQLESAQSKPVERLLV